MKCITVIAHGSPGSFARKVQEDPSRAVALLKAAEAARMKLAVYGDPTSGVVRDAIAALDAGIEIAKFVEAKGGAA